ncbi:MAG: hypothetical protein Kow0025_01840 [Thermodesulfovibrionales bacterium]
MRDVKFLVVDDSETVRKMVRKIIETSFGARDIFEAPDGEDAIKVLESEKVDMIISDWNMPRMSGDDLLYRVRNEMGLDGIPFIMMSVNTSRDFVLTAIQLGATQYIAKPFSPKEFEDKVRTSWNYAYKRRAQRYAALPQHRVTFRLGDAEAGAEIINISRTGVLLLMEYHEGLRLFDAYDLGIEIKDVGKEGPLTISPLVGILVRLEVEEVFHPFSRMCLAAFYLRPNALVKEVENNLTRLLDFLGSRVPDLVSDNPDSPAPRG